jgi:nucleoside-diphosphate-sugar epimerase
LEQSAEALAAARGGASAFVGASSCGEIHRSAIPAVIGIGMTVLIAGCGYLGSRVATQLIAAGHRVIGLTRSSDAAPRLREIGIEPVTGDLSNEDFVRSLEPVDAAVHCAASGRRGGIDAYRRVYLDGVRNLVRVQPRGRLIFTSSTSVYAQTDGSWVSEESAAEPSRETGKILRAAELAVIEADGCVLRLAGLYGPARSVLLRQFLLGEARIDVRSEPPLTPDGRWINQIHRDDAAAAAAFAFENQLTGVFNTADRTPMTQRTIYAELAHRFSKPMPPDALPATDRARGWTHKRVCSDKLVAAGWQPQFPSWFDALDGDPELVPSVLSQGIL